MYSNKQQEAQGYRICTCEPLMTISMKILLIIKAQTFYM